MSTSKHPTHKRTPQGKARTIALRNARTAKRMGLVK